MTILLHILRRALVVGAIALGSYVLLLFLLCKVRKNGTSLVYYTSEVYVQKGGNSFRKFQDYDAARRYDVVALGSSHAYRGYDPAIFRQNGIDLFNLGSSSQTPINSYAIIEEYLTKGNTGLVLLDCYENAMALDGLESTADLAQNITSDAALLRMFAAIRDPRILNMFVVRKMMSGTPPAYEDSTYTEAGFSSRTDSVKGTVDYGLQRTFEVSPEQPRYLVKCIRTCQERGIPIVLVSHPLPKAANRSRHEALRTVIDSVCAATGVEYLDYSFDHGLPLDDRRHFYDHNHFNQAGVSIYDPRVIEDLRTKGYLPQRQR